MDAFSKAYSHPNRTLESVIEGNVLRSDAQILNRRACMLVLPCRASALRWGGEARFCNCGTFV